ncbi:MipA/OmpV family protein [Sulfurifustis variabilis]|nr:MipA/OmpV family protein [Sulfurifustis variabilis]
MRKPLAGTRPFGALLLCCLCHTALADRVADITEVYAAAGVPGQEREPPAGWRAVVGLGLASAEEVVGDGERRTLVLPVLLMTYDDWAYWSIAGGGVWIRSTDRSLHLGVGVKLHAGWRPEDDPLLAGMDRRDTSVDGSLNLLWKTPVVDVGLNYYRDLLDVSDGSFASLRLSRTFLVDPRIRLTPSLGVERQSDELVDYYYGVRPSEATSFRPAYDGRATVNVTLGLTGAYLLNRGWSLLGAFHATRFGDGVADSPIVPDRTSRLLFFGAVRRL